MIQANTKCVVKSAPECLAHLVGSEAIAAGHTGQRGTGTQAFTMDGGRMIYGNADSGIVVEAKD